MNKLSQIKGLGTGFPVKAHERGMLARSTFQLGDSHVRIRVFRYCV